MSREADIDRLLDEVAARMGFYHMIMQDALLHIFTRLDNPLSDFEASREAWMDKLRTTELQPHVPIEQADRVMEIQTIQLRFAAEFFDALGAEIKKKLQDQ